jgi:hypothetical protein
LEAFERDALSVGLYITFVWSVLSYEVVKMYPAMRQRYLWVLRTSCDLHPELYNNCDDVINGDDVNNCEDVNNDGNKH